MRKKKKEEENLDTESSERTPCGNGDSNWRDEAARQGTSRIAGAHQKLEEDKEEFYLQALEGT